MSFVYANIRLVLGGSYLQERNWLLRPVDHSSIHETVTGACLNKTGLLVLRIEERERPKSLTKNLNICYNFLLS